MISAFLIVAISAFTSGMLLAHVDAPWWQRVIMWALFVVDCVCAAIAERVLEKRIYELEKFKRRMGDELEYRVRTLEICEEVRQGKKEDI